MEIEKIKAIADIFDLKGLSYLEISEGDMKICLKKDAVANMQYQVCATPAQHSESFNPATANEKSASAPADTGLVNISAPLAGVFYSSPSPESEPFIKVGSRVKKGDVLCIIEAMKVMNELTADYDGEIAEICAQSGQIVEYNQTVIKIRL